MKKISVAKLNAAVANTIPPHLETLETDAHDAGYTLAFDAATNELTFTATGSYKQYLPKIQVETVLDNSRGEKPCYWFNATLTFPELKQVDLEWSDFMHWVIDSLWGAVGKLMTRLAQTPYDLNVVYED